MNIAFDRTPEKIFFDALALTMEDWKDVEVVNYTATESMHLEAIAGTYHKKIGAPFNNIPSSL